jgi:AAT family amino acid transporter
MSIFPWNELGTKGSPFVLTFKQIGIPAAAGIINFVVLTAALSSCNSGIFSTSRMLFNLAENGKAPRKLDKVTKNGVPGLSVIVSAVVLLVGVFLNYVVPAKVFTWVTSIATFAAIWTWGVILLTQIRYRKSLNTEEKKALKYKTPLFPYSSYLSLVFLALVLVVMAFNPDTRIALYVGPFWIIFLVAFYYIKGFHKSE